MILPNKGDIANKSVKCRFMNCKVILVESFIRYQNEIDTIALSVQRYIRHC